MTIKYVNITETTKYFYIFSLFDVSAIVEPKKDNIQQKSTD